MPISEQERAEALANDMNIDEGHLGGYIRSGSDPTRSGMNVEHGDPATWMPELWSWAHDRLGVRSVLDVGCGEGHAAGYFRDLRCEVRGVDGSVQAQQASKIADVHVRHDFIEGPYQPERMFDLVWSCEFVEHVEEQYVENFLLTFRYSRRFVMMTYAPPGQPGWHHVNCQPQEYWVEKLANIGFTLDEALTEESRGMAQASHYAGKGLLFRR